MLGLHYLSNFAQDERDQIPDPKTPFCVSMTRPQTISSPYFDDGFLPSQPAVSRLPSQWDVWEDILFEAASRLGFELSPSPNGIPELEGWRDSVRKVRIHLHRSRRISPDTCIDGCSLFGLLRCLCYPHGGCITILLYSFGLDKFWRSCSTSTSTRYPSHHPLPFTYLHPCRSPYAPCPSSSACPRSAPTPIRSVTTTPYRDAPTT